MHFWEANSLSCDILQTEVIYQGGSQTTRRTLHVTHCVLIFTRVKNINGGRFLLW